MGCTQSSADGTTRVNIKVTKGHDKSKLSKDDFIFSKLVGTEENFDFKIKEPGTINGQQFTVEECKNSAIFLLDNIECVTVDCCDNILLAIGPTAGSVFLRDVTNSVLFITCQQLRLRDCRGCEIYLFSTTRPITENSSDIQFQCLTWSYFEMHHQFEKIFMNVWTNKWYDIYDFTPGDTISHYKYISDNQSLDVTLRKYVSNDNYVFLLSKGYWSANSDQSSFLPKSYGLKTIKMPENLWNNQNITASSGLVLLIVPIDLHVAIRDIVLNFPRNIQLLRSDVMSFSNEEIHLLFSKKDIKQIGLDVIKNSIILEILVSEMEGITNESEFKNLIFNGNPISDSTLFFVDNEATKRTTLIFETWVNSS